MNLDDRINMKGSVAVLTVVLHSKGDFVFEPIPFFVSRSVHNFAHYFFGSSAVSD